MRHSLPVPPCLPSTLVSSCVWTVSSMLTASHPGSLCLPSLSKNVLWPHGCLFWVQLEEDESGHQRSGLPSSSVGCAPWTLGGSPAATSPGRLPECPSDWLFSLPCPQPYFLTCASWDPFPNEFFSRGLLWGDPTRGTHKTGQER